MKICCLSDLHGHLPDVPDCDLLLLAGDYCPMRDLNQQIRWMSRIFKPWINGLAKRMAVVSVAGNHDFLFQQRPLDVPQMDWTYLQDEEATVCGFRIFASPWQPFFGNWAFNAKEPELRTIWRKIPEGIDILLLHGPPRGYGDRLPYGDEHVGSPSLTERIFEVCPRLVVAGHIHCSYGRYQMGETICVNAAHVDESYRPANPPILVELDVC